jgi:AcrR family transcriptional regulator
MARTAEGTTRPMRADARRNYERLVAAARTAFAERGADASLDDIAKRAGVGPGTLYRHFPTRQALLKVVVEEWVQNLREESGRYLAERPDEALMRWLGFVVRYLSTYRGLSAALVDAYGDATNELTAPSTEIHEVSKALIVRAQEAGTLRADIDPSQILQLVSGIAYMVDKTRDKQPEHRANADALLPLLLDGLRPR